MDNPRSESSELFDPALDAGRSADGIPLAQRAVRGGLWLMVSTYWTIGFGFLANIVLTRMLGPEAFGVFTLAMFFTQLYRIQPRLGLSKAFANYAQDDVSGAFNTYIGLEYVAAAVSIVVAVVAQAVLPKFGYSREVSLISVVLLGAALLESFVNIGLTLLDRELQFRQSSWINAVAFTVSYIPAFILASQQQGVWALVAQTSVYNILYLAGVWIFVYRKFPYVRHARPAPNSPLAGQFLRFGLSIGLIAFISVLVMQLDSFLIGTYVGETALGYYNRAFRTAQWPSLLLDALLARTVFFTYVRLREDNARLQKTWAMVTWMISVLALGLGLMIVVAAPDLVELLYGETWLPSIPLLRILVLYAVIHPLWANASSLLVALGSPGLMAKYNFMRLLIIVASGFPLTLAWGEVGTSVAVVGSLALAVIVIYARVIVKKLGLRLSAALVFPWLACGIAGLGYLALSRVLPWETLTLPVRLIAKLGYAALAFGALMLLAQPRSTLSRLRTIWTLITAPDHGR